ncbi:MAG: hypothetical protein H7268_14385 [Sandarakinorhabdus sp.]|nr:hypothetical protein [Sandarakinorhabdus sp.]
MLLLVTGCASVQSDYRPMRLTGGYSDKLVEPGLWKVVGGSNGYTATGTGRNMAMYRAAEVIDQAGFSQMQIIDQKGVATSIAVNNVSGGTSGEELTLWVRGTNNPAAPLDCRAADRNNCMTLEVAEVKARLEGTFKRPK